MGGATLAVALILTVAACTGSGSAGSTNTVPPETVFVEPDYGSDMVVINVTITDEAFEPPTVFVPAGRPIRLVLRNLGTTEHHFRVIGLIPADLGWYLAPDITPEELAGLPPDEQERLGVDLAIDDPEHTAHHLMPTFVPFKDTSFMGVTPLPNEVHGYTQVGTSDILSFFATNTGTFKSEDVLHPEITGRVVVFEGEG